MVMSADLAGPLRTLGEAVLTPAMFICFAAILAVAVIRVQRGDIAAERGGLLLPIAAEFILMSLGARVPVAIAGLRRREPAGDGVR